VPTAAAVFPSEIYIIPRLWANSSHNIVALDSNASRGISPAMEEAFIARKDVRAVFRIFAINAPKGPRNCRFF